MPENNLGLAKNLIEDAGRFEANGHKENELSCLRQSIAYSLIDIAESLRALVEKEQNCKAVANIGSMSFPCIHKQDHGGMHEEKGGYVWSPISSWCGQLHENNGRDQVQCQSIANAAGKGSFQCEKHLNHLGHHKNESYDNGHGGEW